VRGVARLEQVRTITGAVVGVNDRWRDDKVPADGREVERKWIAAAEGLRRALDAVVGCCTSQAGG